MSLLSSTQQSYHKELGVWCLMLVLLVWVLDVSSDGWHERWRRTCMAQSLKQQVRNAIKAGDLELALELLKGLRNPEPPKQKRKSKLDQPYRLPFVIKE
jgi:hypothetical protein